MLALRAFFAMVPLALTLAACSIPGPEQAPDGIWDPNEPANRRVHAFNTRVDDKVLRGAGTGVMEALPAGGRQAVSQFADTVGTPQTVVNQLLQLRLWRATQNTLRFALNATVGLGVLDPASELGLTPDKSDFGETLAVWGVPEGAYMVVPFVGPSTERGATGMVVDLFTDPLAYVLHSPERYLPPLAKAADRVIARGEFSQTVDSVLYDSSDAYAQTRLMHLQHRRYTLGAEDPASADIDPMALDTTGF
ncbi:MlaA family lipoprotein [Sagittula salina]|uniref:VacJ family lipoprotein n=1 Tax=Sagittula salina TaxID=2820268 RepID=A0A940MS98_9RHOB|nr:VacJ family lipoprotein [Sagittula salina]MBP0483758.1 VacJ family lipoprotein [Sagittula salina]